ncbi:hypothetical protein Vadar_013016 [Vaccinium darrowii]|uniref:Uncharacterized protein n=1 Tax=Vaccinium darrowii TaxID=229202 RepID=A0ACB7X0V3_9ERIC|nr:hypothetical protein Vadar_013016 [Vaccinium darrowii]
MILGGTWKIEKSKATLKARWFCVNECDANLRVHFIASFYWIASCIALRRGLGISARSSLKGTRSISGASPALASPFSSFVGMNVTTVSFRKTKYMIAMTYMAIAGITSIPMKMVATFGKLL